MARKYIIGATVSNAIPTLAEAFDDYYGEGNYTIYYQTTEYLVFKIPTITDKVLRFRYDGNTILQLYYGDEWTSGSTITNAYAIHTANYKQPVGNLYFVLGEKTFLFYNRNIYVQLMFFVTILTDNRVIGLSITEDYSASTAYCLGKDLTTNASVYPYSFQPIRFNATTEQNKIITFPLYYLNSGLSIMSNASTGALVYSEDIMTTPSISTTNLTSLNIMTMYAQWKYNTSNEIGYNSFTLYIDIDNYTL